MCMDPLGRVQLLVSEAIRLLAEETQGRVAHDPGVAEAVLARLKDAEARIQEVQAGFSRKEAWRVTREVISEVSRLVVEVVLRALATYCNFLYCRSYSVYYAARLYNQKVSSRQRFVAGGTRDARGHIGFVLVFGRTRQTRTYTERAA